MAIFGQWLQAIKQYSDAGFTRRLKKAGFAVEIVFAKSRPDGTGARHLIWFARKPG